MKYRAEIDGLRALAVVPVILFHAGFELFSGGFVGVDVFFVISGYLIATILIEDIEHKRFSIVNFYERRARRILPALFFVMLVCIPFAWMWMLPNEMKGFLQSLVVTSLFISNVFFWKKTNYFGGSAEEMPLLHTWSLAVEEQYYVLFPIFLILAWRFGKNRVFWLIILIAAISLLLCEWGWRNTEMAHFYLAPTRAWELLSGSIAAFIVQSRGVRSSNLLSLIGLGAIVFSIFLFNKTTPFPSIYSLLPVLGVIFIILYADEKTLTSKLLSYKLFVGVGLISYSSYLWHQPIFAFTRLQSLAEPSSIAMLLLTTLSVSLGYLSWRFVEAPFRNNCKFSQKSIFSMSILGILIFTIFGYVGQLNGGFDERFTESDRQFLADINENNKTYVTTRFDSAQFANWESNKIKILLVGDSYAQDLLNAVSEVELNIKFSFSTWGIGAECGNLYVPFDKKKPFITQRKIPKCKAHDLYLNNDFIDKIKEADQIWLASHWLDWHVELLAESIRNIKDTSSADLILFGRKDFPPFNLKQYVGLSSDERSDFAASVDEEAISLNLNIQEKTNATKFIDTQAIMCGGDAFKCKTFTNDGYLKTYDGGHLTMNGAKYLGNSLIPFLDIP